MKLNDINSLSHTKWNCESYVCPDIEAVKSKLAAVRQSKSNACKKTAKICRRVFLFRQKCDTIKLQYLDDSASPQSPD